MGKTTHGSHVSSENEYIKTILVTASVNDFPLFLSDAEAINCLPGFLACFQILPAFPEKMWKMFPVGTGNK